MQPPNPVETFIAALDRGDQRAAAAVTTDDVVVHLPGGGEARGEDAIREFASGYGIVEESRVSLRLADLRTLDTGELVAELHLRNEDRGSGEPRHEMRVGGWFTLRDDRIAAVRAFGSLDEALEAAERR
jgi:limonene-1,2-epoxide hydrolase